MSKRGKIKVHKITCVADCGQVFNSHIAKQQLEGGILYGLTAALKGEINVQGGQVVQSNFDDYPMLKLKDTPEIKYISWRTTRTGRSGRSRNSTDRSGGSKCCLCSHGQTCAAAAHPQEGFGLTVLDLATKLSQYTGKVFVAAGRETAFDLMPASRN
ncbi:MAG: hypothetical protein Ct9H300mP28_06690 [Pseudomonadota bacterium]|nr:MAG: hypothetical protein Ct9H300mP28_06690 [Pseudomonadota bacterium]